MTKIFLDTNVWLRYLLQDNRNSKSCGELIQAIEAGKFRPYTSTIVLLEINYVLTSLYKIPISRVAKDIRIITKTRNLTIIEKTNFPEALNLYQKTKIKLADCLIATQLPTNSILVTFDKDFKKVPKLAIQTPKYLPYSY